MRPGTAEVRRRAQRRCRIGRSFRILRPACAQESCQWGELGKGLLCPRDCRTRWMQARQQRPTPIEVLRKGTRAIDLRVLCSGCHEAEPTPAQPLIANCQSWTKEWCQARHPGGHPERVSAAPSAQSCGHTRAFGSVTVVLGKTYLGFPGAGSLRARRGPSVRMTLPRTRSK